MTLKEKLCEPFGGLKTETLNDLEQIADDFAVGFVEFSINYNYHPMHKVWIRCDKMINEKLSTKQLLEIYKKTL